MANFKGWQRFYRFAVETLSGECADDYRSQDQRPTPQLFGGLLTPPPAGYAEEATRILLRYAFYELRHQKCNSANLNPIQHRSDCIRKWAFEEAAPAQPVYQWRYYDGSV
jgi:hypothetical protein